LLWSLRRFLAWESLEVVVVDNGSKDGSAELLAKIDAAGGCRLIPNAGNTMHGPALTQAMSFLASKGSELPRWVWVLDSDIVISRPDALQQAVRRAALRVPLCKRGLRAPRPDWHAVMVCPAHRRYQAMVS
jgi:glycosyltransferase involved in cell wall biosynthesis